MLNYSFMIMLCNDNLKTYELYLVLWKAKVIIFLWKTYLLSCFQLFSLIDRQRYLPHKNCPKLFYNLVKILWYTLNKHCTIWKSYSLHKRLWELKKTNGIFHKGGSGINLIFLNFLDFSFFIKQNHTSTYQ